jgi:hypothetical protein
VNFLFSFMCDVFHGGGKKCIVFILKGNTWAAALGLGLRGDL